MPNTAAPALDPDLEEFLACIPGYVPRKSTAAPAEAAEDAPDSERSTQAQKLLELAEAWVFFTAKDGRAYALVPVGAADGHQETLPVRSKDFRNGLSMRYYRQYGRPPGATPLQDVLAILEARARFDGECREVFCRVGGTEHEHGSQIYLDLCNPSWSAVEITAAGWSVVATPAVHLRRTRGMLALPHPVPGGSMAELRPFVNVAGEDDWRLLVGWFLAALRPQGPYPVLCLQGEQGSAKSTTARVIRSLIDPNGSPVRCEPREVRDLAIAAANSWVIALDNLSRLPAWLSDALCRLSTGGGFSTRQLHTDAEEILFDGQRPVILTGIEDVVTRGDLLDRCLVLQLPTIPEEKYRPEADFWRAWELARPRVLGALLDAAACALRQLPATRLTRLPRMADFSVWVTAAEPALSWTPGAFLDSYLANRSEASSLSLEASPLVEPLRQLLVGRGVWQGNCTELLDALAGLAGNGVVRSRTWPANPHLLGGALRRLAPNLRRSGVGVEFAKSRKRGRMVTLRAADGGAGPG